MTDPTPLEDLVADFLDERESPELEPAEFAARHPEDADRIEQAIEATLQALHAMTDSAPLEQKRIGAFRVLREIGRGGMGIVYEAERSGNRYAIKLIPFAPITNARAVERFRREIEGLSRLDHENIVSIVDAGVQDGAPYIVMEYVDGDSLAASASVPSTKRAAETVRSVAYAVQAAHDRGVIHRDVKPQNVMIRRDGSPVLLDFGLMASEDMPSLTETGDFVGTPRYMPPERIRGEPADTRTDVYGLGMILYELIVGQPAYGQPSRETIIQAVTRGAFVPPRRIRSDVERDLEKIVLTAVAYEPKRRYPSAKELAMDLGRFLEGEPVQARPPGPVTRTLDRIARTPLRSAAMAVVLIAILALGARSYVTTTNRPVSAEAVREAEIAAARAVARWFDLYREDAAAAAREALAKNRDDLTARAIRARFEERRPTQDNEALVDLFDAMIWVDGRDLSDDDDDTAPRSSVEIDASLLRVLAEEPANPLALALRAKIARREGRYLEAEEYLSAALRSLDDCAWVHRSLAWLHEKSGRYDDALLRVERAIEIKPTSSKSLALLARIHARRGSIEKGLAAIERAKAASRDRDDNYLLTIEGSLLDEVGRREEARACFRRILDEEPRDAQAWYNLALSHDADHHLEEAVAGYENAVRYTRHEPDERSLTNLANLYSGASMGSCAVCDELYAAKPQFLDLPRAFGYWKRAVEADNRKTSVVHQALLALGLRFERDEVVSFLEGVAAREPDSAQSRRVARILRRLRMQSK